MNCAAQLSIVYLHMVHFYNEKDKNNTHNFFLHYSVVYVCVHVHAGRPTSEVFHFEVFRTGLLSQQWVVQHDFSLSFDALVELSHRHMT